MLGLGAVGEGHVERTLLLARMQNGLYFTIAIECLPSCRADSVLLALRWACAWPGRALPWVCASSLCAGATSPRPRHDLATTSPRPRHDLATTSTVPLRTASLRAAPLRTSACAPRVHSAYVCHAHVGSRPPCIHHDQLTPRAYYEYTACAHAHTCTCTCACTCACTCTP